MFLIGCGPIRIPTRGASSNTPGGTAVCWPPPWRRAGSRPEDDLPSTPARGPLRTVLESVDLEYSEADRPHHAYPVQLVRFGNDLCIVALAHEVVVDYSLRLKRELAEPGGPAIWVAGYSNVCSGYIPSRRVLREGGYEASSRPWKPTLEELIVGKVHALFDRLDSAP